MIDLARLKNVHCVGIGGIGVSAAAKFLRLQGVAVSGSDQARSIVTKEAEAAGIRVTDPDASNVTADTDLVIHTSAAPETHPERVEAERLNVPQLSYFAFLGLLSRSRRTIAVCGTNGKSTTTAMLGLMLERAGLDPLVIVGSRVPGFAHGNLRPGGGVCVVEACEYRAQFLHLAPSMVATTKIVEDHLDYYRDLAHIQETFRAFVTSMPADGLLLWNVDDAGSRGAYETLEQSAKRFGFSDAADVRAERHAVTDGVQTFDAVFKEGIRWAGLRLHVPGNFNVQNALAAIAAARALGASETAVREALEGFTGIWRRFERVGVRNGAAVISDYGHTPDAIEATLDAARAFYPGKKIVLAFQPHHHDRTRKLFDAFTAAFDKADTLVLTEIYGVAGRAEGEGEISSRDLAAAVRARGTVTDVHDAADLDETVKQLAERADERAIIIVMGAGDIDAVARTLCQKNP